MKFYDTSSAPSPRRVRIFLAEKGIKIPTVQVDLRAGAHLQPEFLKINPAATVPVLELDDGTTIGEAIACCRYLEETYPEPPLMGRDAKDKAVIAMWEHRCEIEGFLAVVEALRNEAKGMKGRALPGPVGHEQIPALAERGRARIGQFFAWLNARLGESECVGSAAYSVADITGFVTVEFAGWIKVMPPVEQTHLHRWLAAMRSRPSAAA